MNRFKAGDEVEVSRDNKNWEDGWFFATYKKDDWNCNLCYKIDCKVGWFLNIRRPQPKDTEESLLQEAIDMLDKIKHGNARYAGLVNKLLSKVGKLGIKVTDDERAV